MQKALLVCYVSSKTGIGHLSRLLALAQNLKKDKKIVPEFLILGDIIKLDSLKEFQIHNFSFNSDFNLIIQNIWETKNFDVIIFDIYPSHKINNLCELFKKIKQHNISIISIDSLIEHCDLLDLIWIPSFNFDCSKYTHCKSLLKSGWDTYLIQKHLKTKEWIPGSKVLILTGGSDVLNLGKTLPTELDTVLQDNLELNWVKGPLSKEPLLPKKPRLNWTIHDAPQRLDELITQSNYVISVFGISFFEVLQYGVPAVVFSPYNNKDENDLKALSKENVAKVVNNSKLAVEALFKLINDDEIASIYSINALKKMSVNGVKNLSTQIYSLIKI